MAENNNNGCGCTDYGDKGCRFEVYKDTGFCIFHLPKLTAEQMEKLSQEEKEEYKKTEKKFKKDFFELLEKWENEPDVDILDFTGFQFGYIDFNKHIFTKKAIFCEAIFVNEVYFREATFKEEADFSMATFENRADFKRVTFKKLAYFRWATLENEANFSEVTFDEEADFKRSKLENIAFFLEAKFKKKAFFYEATFKEATFDKTIFDEADFRKTTFKKGASFNESQFEKKASFREATLNEAFFYKAILNDVDFSMAKFENLAFFYETTFKKAVFAGASFKDANFGGAQFKNQTYFQFTTFKDATFPGATFMKRAIFSGVTFKNNALFISKGKDGCFKKECDFRQVDINKDANIVFEKTNLKKANFTDTDLELIKFRDVDWHEPQKGWPRREKALYDEFRDPDKGEKQDYSKLAENYCQLVLNYERKRDFDSAEQFHIGEMEVRRKSIGAGAKTDTGRRFWELCNTYNVYRFLSNYGTSYWLAFSWILLFLFLFSLSSLYTGFVQISKETDKRSEIIEYNAGSDINHQPVSFCQWCADLREACSYSLSIITFQRSRFYEPEGLASRYLLSIATIFFYGQLSLLLLAIRRRFKR